MCAQGLCKDAKPTEHTQTLALRKVMHEAIHIIRIVRFLRSMSAQLYRYTHEIINETCRYGNGFKQCWRYISPGGV